MNSRVQFILTPTRRKARFRPCPTGLQRDPDSQSRLPTIERNRTRKFSASFRLTIAAARAVTSAGHASSAALRPQTTRAAGCWAVAAPPAAAAPCPPTLQAFTSQRTAQTSVLRGKLSGLCCSSKTLGKEGKEEGRTCDGGRAHPPIRPRPTPSPTRRRHRLRHGPRRLPQRLEASLP